MQDGYTNESNTLDGNQIYTIPIIGDGLKDYYISQETYTTDAFGSKPVLTPISDEGEDRFYIMALEDLGGKGKEYSWFYMAYEYVQARTSGKFGTGKANTEALLESWKGGHSSLRDTDIWGAFESENVPDGWFVPSREELAACMQELGITASNYEAHNLSGYYWSSTGVNPMSIWMANVRFGSMGSGYPNTELSVRLSATF